MHGTTRVLAALSPAVGDMVTTTVLLLTLCWPLASVAVGVVIGRAIRRGGAADPPTYPED